MTSDSNKNLANKWCPVILSDADFGESDCIEMHHMASTQSTLGVNDRGRLHVSLKNKNKRNQAMLMR
jgi:hypothetical protein